MKTIESRTSWFMFTESRQNLILLRAQWLGCSALLVVTAGLAVASRQVLAEAPAAQGCVNAAELVKKGVNLGDGSEKEIALYREAESLCPKMAEVHFNLGLALQKQGDLSAAEKELRQAVAIKDEETFRVGLAGVLVRKGDLLGAREQYDHVLEMNAKNVPALQGRAVVLEKQQKIDEAVATLEKASAIDPGNEVTFFNLGVLHEKAKRLELAAGSYRKAAMINPRHFEALYYLGSVLNRQGKFDEARRAFLSAAEVRPDDVRVHLGLAESYEKAGDSVRAEASLRRVSELSPNNFAAQANLGLLLIENKRFQEAVKVLQRATALEPKNARAWSALGRAQLELGSMADAEKNLRQAIELDSTNAYAHNNLGVLLQRLDRMDEARREFSTALRLNPELEVARKNLDAVGAED